PAQTQGLKIKEINPVVNENRAIALTAVDSNGQPVSGATFESGSPDIASVDSTTGMAKGVNRGFATITARRGSDSVSIFVTVVRVDTGKGARVPGDAKTDTGGRIYLSDPIGSVILRKDGFASEADIYAGKKGTNGKTDGSLND